MIDIINTTYKAAAYIRISKEDLEKSVHIQEESISIKNQRDIIMEYAKTNNIEIYDYYIDDGYSGGNFKRPGFQRMIHDIENSKINCVITKDTSRLGREFIETGNYMFKYFPEHKVRYIAILENFDTINPNGVEDIIPFKTVINDMYLKDISRKIKSVRHELMKKGLFVGSSVPYGYKRSDEDSRKFIIDEYAATIIRRIFDMKVKGMSDVMIARTLTKEGILPPDVYKNKKMNRTITTNLWKAASIKNILKNEVYIGTLIQGKYERVSLKSKKKVLLPRDKWIIREENHAAIIDKELFMRVNADRINEEKCNIRFRKYDYLLKGIVKCHDCGKTMLVRRCGNKKNNEDAHAVFCCRTYASYRNSVCSMHYYREELLNQLILENLKNIFKQYITRDILEKRYNKVFEEYGVIHQYKTELKKCQLRLYKFDKTLFELYNDRTEGIINDNEFISIKEGVIENKKLLEKKIEDLRVVLAKIDNVINKEQYKLRIISNFLNVIDLDKQLLCDLINKITIDKNKKIRIYFKFYI